MKTIAGILVFSLFLGTLLTTGCVSKSKARTEAKAAFYQGQARAMEAQHAQQASTQPVDDIVAIIGPVRVPALRWTPDLTLMKTIVGAEYIPSDPPSQILITRQGKQFPVSAVMLLEGEDIPVFSGDVVELRP